MRGRALTAIGLGDKGLRSALEQSLMNGSTLLIENVGEELDPVLDPVLDQRFVRKVRQDGVGKSGQDSLLWWPFGPTFSPAP